MEILTVAIARELKGKRISYSANGYQDQTYSGEIVVGDIVSQWEYNKTQPMKGYKSRTDYWKSYMTPEQIDAEKNTLILLDENGEDKHCLYAYINRYSYFDEDTFTLSDADRPVSYEML